MNATEELEKSSMQCRTSSKENRWTRTKQTVRDLCTIDRRVMVFFEHCPSDDWTRDALNEVSSTLSKFRCGDETDTTTGRTKLTTNRVVKQGKQPKPNTQSKQEQLPETQPNFSTER